MEYGRNITIGGEEFQVGVKHSGTKAQRLAYTPQNGDEWNEVDESGIVHYYSYEKGEWVLKQNPISHDTEEVIIMISSDDPQFDFDSLVVNVTDNTDGVTHHVDIDITGEGIIYIPIDHSYTIEFPVVEDHHTPATVTYTAERYVRQINVNYNIIQHYYGVIIPNNSDTDLIRIGDMELHRTLPIHNKIRGCILNDSGDVVEYLPADDWTSATRDGSLGQVMVELPDLYMSFTEESDGKHICVSEQALPGYQFFPKCYVGAYEAALDRTNNKLASVVNTSTQYRGGDNTSSWDGTYRSLLGRPATYLSRTECRTYARNRSQGTSWNILDIDRADEITWLFCIEYATRNCQKAFNSTTTAEGYKQGGLGTGVTGLTSEQWSTYNSHNPFVPCGTTDTLGNGTGIVYYTAKNSDNSTLYIAPVPRYRGIENPFGHIWKWIDGCNIQVDASVTTCYICNDPLLYHDNNYLGYTSIGNTPRVANFVTDVLLGTRGCIVCKTNGGSDTTYYCDNYYTNTTQELKALLFGGDSTNGSSAGLFCSASSTAPSVLGTYIGSRLIYIPTQTTQSES